AARQSGDVEVVVAGAAAAGDAQVLRELDQFCCEDRLLHDENDPVGFGQCGFEVALGWGAENLQAYIGARLQQAHARLGQLFTENEGGSMFHEEEGPMLTRTLAASVVSFLFSFGVFAQDLPKTQFKVIGLNGPTVASMVDEVPFWRETITKASNGAITADITPLDQMGIDDKTMLRLLRLGVMDFAGMDI